jgi:hypothetical protein
MDYNAYSNVVATAIVEANRLEEFLASLGCSVHKRGRTYRGPCPVHGGAGHNFQVNTTGDVIPIRWTCWSSEKCHEKYKPSVLGLVRGVLSHQRGKPVSLNESMQFLKGFVGQVPAKTLARPRPSGPPPKAITYTREAIRARLQIPAPYFVGRGFSPAVLDAMDVGYSTRFGCSSVPLYNERDVCIGFASRTHFPLCESCKFHHEQGSPCGTGEMKWRFSSGFPRGSYLYNLTAAGQSLSPTVLLVEGPGDVWKATEAGVLAVSSLGKDVTDDQAELLARLGKTVFIAFDNDESGRSGAAAALRTLSCHRVRAKQIHVPATYHDVGEMSVDHIKEWLKP